MERHPLSNVARAGNVTRARASIVSMRKHFPSWVWVALSVLFALGIGVGHRYWLAAALLRGLEAEQAAPGGFVETRIELGAERAPARLYRPQGDVRQRLVVLHGVHHLGIDEPRLVRFARELSRIGCLVLTPKLESLTEYRLEPGAISTIDTAVRVLAADGAGGPREVGLIGFSFAGGLALLAAADADVEEHLDYVVSVGGHHDLGRVMHFLVDNRVVTPAGPRPMKAHEYGLVIAVYQNVEYLVPLADQEAMREAFLHWLEEDRDAAWVAASRRTTPEAERLFDLLVSERLSELAPELDPLLTKHELEFRALSPHGMLARIHVPLYWLHGATDNVIPPSEAAWAELERPRGTSVLVSPLIQHVEVAHHATLSDELRLLHFMARLI